MIFCQTGQFSTTVGFRQPWSLRQQFDLIQNYCIHVILVLGINNTTLDQDLQAQLWHLGFSPIKIDKLKELLENYPDRDVASLLYNSFTKEFRLEYTGPRNHILTNNILSAHQFCSETRQIEI